MINNNNNDGCRSCFYLVAAVFLLGGAADGLDVEVTIQPPPFVLEVPARLINGVSVFGNLCCAGGAPLPGVPLRLNCNNSVFVGKNTTAIDGRFNITLRNLTPLNLAQILPCKITINISINQPPPCTISPTLSTTSTSTSVITGLVQFFGASANQAYPVVVASGIIVEILR